MALLVLLCGVPAVAEAMPAPRGYELVSPPGKGGGDVMADAARTRASISGDAVTFASLAPFGDAQGSGIATEYMSERTGSAGTNGWATHTLIPQVNPLSFFAATRGLDTLYQGEFSDDLSKGVLFSYSAVTNDPNVAGVANLYLRQDALSGGAGSYTLLSACPGCSAPLSDPSASYHPFVADATPDLGHVIFEAPDQLTADAPAGSGNPNLYEWDHGTLRFVAILPNGSSAPLSIAGNGALQHFYTLNTISDDGSKIFFTVPPDAFSFTGDLYMRVNHSTTVQLNASERTDCADHDPCTGALEPDPAGHQSARFATASADGSKVFFTDAEQLTDAPGGDLYVYDTTLPVSDPNHLRHVYSDQQPADGTSPTDAVLGTSNDGSYVYFADQGAILSGQPTLPANASDGIYVWHNGTVNFIGSVDGSSFQSDSIDTFWDGSRLNSRVTPDGHTLLFRSDTGAGLGGYDHGSTCGAFSGDSCAELYRYSVDSGRVVCVSCNPSGAPATSDARFTVQTSTGGAQTTSHLNHPLTTDGNHVFFETGERLLPQQDTNGKRTDVYEWTAQGVDGCQQLAGCLSLISSGTASEDAHFLDASPSGQDVFFSTNQQLVGWDTDNNYDLYDARIGGGFPEPAPAKPECSGEACQGLIAGPPAIGSAPSSTFFNSTGNVAPPPKKKVVKHCAKGKVRKRVHGKVKCVKKPKPKARKARRSRR